MAKDIGKLEPIQTSTALNVHGAGRRREINKDEGGSLCLCSCDPGFQGACCSLSAWMWGLFVWTLLFNFLSSAITALALWAMGKVWASMIWASLATIIITIIYAISLYYLFTGIRNESARHVRIFVYLWTPAQIVQLFIMLTHLGPHIVSVLFEVIKISLYFVVLLSYYHSLSTRLDTYDETSTALNIHTGGSQTGSSVTTLAEQQGVAKQISQITLWTLVPGLLCGLGHIYLAISSGLGMMFLVMWFTAPLLLYYTVPLALGYAAMLYSFRRFMPESAWHKFGLCTCDALCCNNDASTVATIQRNRAERPAEFKYLVLEIIMFFVILSLVDFRRGAIHLTIAWIIAFWFREQPHSSNPLE